MGYFDTVVYIECKIDRSGTSLHNVLRSVYIVGWLLCGRRAGRRERQVPSGHCRTGLDVHRAHKLLGCLCPVTASRHRCHTVFVTCPPACSRSVTDHHQSLNTTKHGQYLFTHSGICRCPLPLRIIPHTSSAWPFVQLEVCFNVKRFSPTTVEPQP